MHEKQRGRYVSNSKRDRFRDAVKNVGKDHVEITAMVDSSEAIGYAKELRHLIIDNGWGVPNVRLPLVDLARWA